jgi:hypothetical protein
MNPTPAALEFGRLRDIIVADLLAIGTYDQADADDGYDDRTLEGCNMLFYHPAHDYAVYVMRLHDDHTVTVTARDFDYKDIEITSTEEWQPHRDRMTAENGLLIEAVE